MIQITTNVPEYNAVITRYGAARRKTHAEVVTRMGAQANFRFARSEARGGVKRAKLSKHPLGAAADPRKGGKTYKGRFYYAEQASLGVKKGAGGQIVMRPKTLESYTRRRKSRGAIAAGGLVSARKMGLRKRGAKSLQPKPGGSASKSVGTRAKGELRAISINRVNGSYEVGRSAMDRAIKDTIRDAGEFLDRLQKTNDEFQK